MAKDSSLYARQAVLRLLRNAPTVTALVPAARIYPPQRPPKPVWPFIGYGVGTSEPFAASCLDGSATTVRIHAYAETTGEGDDTIDGDEMAHAILRVIVAVLGGEEGAEVSLADTDCPYPATAYISWIGSQVIQDGAEADAFHGFATFSITVSS